jgi:hypothetical protein
MSTLKLKRGLKANLPAGGAAGEPIWATDSQELFIGTGASKVPILPAGLIVMWNGLLANIPAGWALCDGQNNTPDLRSKFIKGAASGQNPGATGGGTYTPAGTVSAPIFSGTQATLTGSVAAPTFTGTASQATSAVSGGTPAGTISGTAVADHASHTHTGASAGTTPKLFTSNTSSGVPGISGGPSATLTHSVTQGTFAGSALATHSHTLTPAGTNSAPALTMNAYTPQGTISAPTFTGTQASPEPSYYALAFIMKL